MQLCFYKASAGDFWDRMIGSLTRSPYSHTELRFSDGMCFSSSPREYGVRFKHIHITEEKWDVLDLDITTEKENEIRTWCESQIGKGYDWFALFGYVYGWMIGWLYNCKTCLDDKAYWYCSEICLYPLVKFNVIKPCDYRIPPGYVFNIFGKRACKI